MKEGPESMPIRLTEKLSVGDDFIDHDIDEFCEIAPPVRVDA
jgi:hypothetical protein